MERAPSERHWRWADDDAAWQGGCRPPWTPRKRCCRRPSREPEGTRRGYRRGRRSPSECTRPLSGRRAQRLPPRTGKKTPRGAGTHTGHRDTRARARGHTDHTDEPHNHPPKQTMKQTPTHPHDHATAETATDSTAAGTAAGPESTAPRGRLRRGRPQRTRPCLHPLPERLPAPARRRSAK